MIDKKGLHLSFSNLHAWGQGRRFQQTHLIHSLIKCTSNVCLNQDNKLENLHLSSGSPTHACTLDTKATTDTPITCHEARGPGLREPSATCAQTRLDSVAYGMMMSRLHSTWQVALQGSNT
eukprot:1140896-Pelagomonas_calceolata.AAC.2